MIVYTSICMNYLPKALVLGKSIKKNNSNVKFYIILLEREIPEDWPSLTEDVVDKVILAKDLGFKDFDKFIFKHSIVEASTAVKGQALEYLLEKCADKVVYIDPDIKTYKSLDALSKMLDEKSIILTPHLTIPEANEIDIQNNELSALQHGVYNLGFVAVKKDIEGLKFAKWWNDRLQLYCYDDIPKGIFTDQRWCDLAPAYFDVMILKNPGYNMAPWNLSTRKISIKNGKILVNNDFELVFFHYSGFDSGANETVFNYYVPDKENPIYKLRNEYIKEMIDNGQELLGHHKWSYNYYSSGEEISRDVRIKYRDKKFFNMIDVNPFALSDSHLLDLMEPSNDVAKNTNEQTSNLRRLFRKVVPLSLRKKILGKK